MRIGAIGAGGRGKIAALCPRVDPTVSLVAAADTDQTTLDAFRADHGSDTFTTRDYRDLVERPDIDAVFVCSPDHLHEKHAIAAMEAGKAVYLEKPIATTIEGSDRVLATARATGSRLFLGHNMRYFPSIVAMRDIIRSGEIGAVQAIWCRHFVAIGGDAYFKDWHSESRNTTSLLLQKGAHDIDVIHWLAGAYTERVVALGKLSVYDKQRRRPPGTPHRVKIDAANWPVDASADYSPDIDVEDHSMVLMNLTNGVQASYLQCHYTPDYWRNYTVIGTHGRIENIGDSGACEIHVFTTRRDRRSEPDRVVSLQPEQGSHGGSDPRIIDSFIRFVRDGVAPHTSPLAARNAVAAGCRATESLRAGGEPRVVEPAGQELIDYFDAGQPRRDLR